MWKGMVCEKMKILEAGENYLETILVLSKKLSHVRSIDIVNELEYSKPTVSVAMKHLREDGYIEVDADGYITLLPKGLEIAERTYEKHEVVSSFLMSMGVSRETALADACKIEHDISDETFECMKKYYSEHKSK